MLSFPNIFQKFLRCRFENDNFDSMTQTSIPEPEPAKIRDSIPCAFCGESVMESRIQQWHAKPACIPCYEKQHKPE
jgi:formylmethanofuran dehydrogenase subunit E